MPFSRTRELGRDAHPRGSLLFCSRECPTRTESATRNARKRSKRVSEFRVVRWEIPRESMVGLRAQSENSAFAVRFRSKNQIGKKAVANQPSVNREYTSQEFSPRLIGCPRQENVSRSICRVRKSYPRGYFFAPDLRYKELVGDRARSEHARPHGRTPSTTHVARTHAFRTTSSARGSIRTSLEPDTGRS